MAYTVGSASVDIVPDFRGAQLAITAWFAKQQDALKIPIRPDLSPETTRVVEQQAQETGNRVGKAISDGVERSTNRNMLSPLSRQIAKLEADIERSQVKTREATDALRLAQLRLDEARKAGNRSASSMLSLEQAVERAQNRVAEANRNGVRSTEQLREARRQLDIETQRSAERSAAAVVESARKQREAQERLGQQMAREIEREAERAQAIRDRELQAQVRLGEQMYRQIEADLARQSAAKQRQLDADVAAEERALQKSLQAIERQAAEREKILAREHAKLERAEEQHAEKSARAALKAIDDAIREGNREKIQIEIDKRHAILEGRTTGGLVARAIHQEMRQNAGLITAAVTGALLVGGPAVTVAATGLFAGIGAVGAFQSDKLRATWVATFQEMRDKGISDTAVLIPAFERMAVSIGGSFDRMRPQLQGAFVDLAPQIDIFSASLTQATENMIPGFVRSIQGGRPIIAGFGDLLEDTGQGLTDFLDNITSHAPAAGQSIGLLGDTMGELLPLLGELLGEGAELGTIVLPVLNSALGGMRTVVEALGGSLPILATGFLAFRTIQGTSRFVQQFSQGLLNIAPNLGVFTERMTGSAVAGERVMSATGRAASGVARFAGALPAVGLAVAGVAMIMADAKQNTDDYASSLIKGGAAARQALADIGDPGVWESITTALSNTFESETWTGGGETPAEAKLRNVKERVQELEGAMNPLELAQSRLAGWTSTLADRLGDEDATAEDVAIALRKVAEYTERSAAEQEKLEKAVSGVTQAMVDQADVARARVDSAFAYEQSLLDGQQALLDVIEAQTALDEARASGDQAAIAQAELDLANAILGTKSALEQQAIAAGELAMSNLPASMDENQRAILGAKASLDELNAMMALGIVLPPELENWRQQLIRITQEADGNKLATAQMTAALSELGFTVAALPDNKGVQITGLEPNEINPIRDRLRELGFDVITLPDNKGIEVRALTDEAKGNVGELSALLVALGIDVPVVVPQVDPGPAVAGANEAGKAVDDLDLKSADPLATLHSDPLVMAALEAQGLLGDLAGLRPTPYADLLDEPLVGAALEDLGLLENLNGQTPTPVAGLDDIELTGTAAADQKILDDLNAQRPTPIADLYDDPLIGRQLYDLGLLGDLAGQRPTPIGLLDDSPLQGTAGTVFGTLADVDRQRPNPVVQATDWASSIIANIQTGINNLTGKTVVITAVHRAVNEVVNGFGQIIGNEGGAVEGLPMVRRYHFDGGGAVVGRGSAKDDLVPAIGPNPFAQYRIANGEHILDGLDVALLGGQSGVYAFREMLKAGTFSGPSQSTGIQQMVSVSGGQSKSAAPTRSTTPREVNLYTPDVPTALRALKAQEHQEEVLAAPWP